MQAKEAYTTTSIPEAQRTGRQAMNHWRLRAAALPPHDPFEPFHSALVEEMDRDLDLFDRGDERFRVPLDVLDLVRSGAEVTGVIAYDQAFAWKADPGPSLIPLKRLFAQQDPCRRSVENQLRAYKRDERLLFWSSLDKEVSQGFGEVHLSRLAPEPGRPDVCVKRLPVARVKWDSPAWAEMTRARPAGSTRLCRC